MNNRANRKRIVFLLGSMRRDGAERVISILANSYADKGWNVDILTLLDDRCAYELNTKINVMPLSSNGKSRLRQLPNWLWGIRKYVKQNNPDKIVSFFARINLITLLASFRLKKHITISERNDPTKDGRTIIVRIATHLIYPLADCVIFQTKWAQSCFPPRIKKKSVVIPNPIYVNAHASKEKKKKIVAVGRLIEQKNHLMLIRAFKKVHEEYPEYSLYIYGEGSLREALTNQIKEMSLIDAVFLPGNIQNIHEEIADAEMFVLSSNYEGLSNALLEAMMMGLSCISTDCAGSNEVIIDRENGLLVPVAAVDKFADAMKQLIANKELAISIGQNAALSSKTFESIKILKQWENEIEANEMGDTRMRKSKCVL